MSVAAPEALTYTDSPPETAGYRDLYIMLLVCGFILRFGFVLWKKTYIGSLNDILLFGEKICTIADRIVLWSEIRALAHRKAQLRTRALTFFPPRT
jgi:hypothetical protein